MDFTSLQNLSVLIYKHFYTNNWISFLIIYIKRSLNPFWLRAVQLISSSAILRYQSANFCYHFGGEKIFTAKLYIYIYIYI